MQARGLVAVVVEFTARLVEHQVLLLKSLECFCKVEETERRRKKIAVKRR